MENINNSILPNVFSSTPNPTTLTLIVRVTHAKRGTYPNDEHTMKRDHIMCERENEHAATLVAGLKRLGYDATQSIWVGTLEVELPIAKRSHVKLIALHVEAMNENSGFNVNISEKGHY